jgi:hypothetical protein
MSREMTADELERFEETQIHHRDETEPDGEPASEAEIEITGGQDRRRPSADPEIPPLNPD